MGFVVLAAIIGLGFLAFRAIRYQSLVTRAEKMNTSVRSLLHDYGDFKNDKIGLAVQVLVRLAYGRAEGLRLNSGVVIHNELEFGNTSVNLGFLFLVYANADRVVDLATRILAHYANMVSWDEPKKLGAAYSMAEQAFGQCKQVYGRLVESSLSGDEPARTALADRLMNAYAGRSDIPEHARRQFQLLVAGLISSAVETYAQIQTP